jgi:YD repeat-containing protein
MGRSNAPPNTPAIRNVDHRCAPNAHVRSGWRIAGLLTGLLLANSVAAQEQATYRYDAFGRLTGVARSVTGAAGNYTGYVNDVADNRLSRGVVSVPTPAVAKELRPGETLVPFQRLTSADGRFTFLFQADGNLVLYFGVTPLWASTTMNGRGLSLRMESGGNLALYDAANAVVWSSGTGGHPGAKLVLQNDGNAVIYDGATPLWATHTCCH